MGWRPETWSVMPASELIVASLEADRPAAAPLTGLRAEAAR